MTSVTVSNKQVRQFCTSEVEMKQGLNQNGDPLYIKFLKIATIDQLDISECLEFNRCVLGDPESLLFPQHFLKIEEEIISKTLVGLVTKPYSQTLQSFVRGKTLTEKDALLIFDQIMKAVYSLYQQGYATKNLRSQHFVLHKKVWKLESLVYSEDYEHANGVTIEYLWSPKHQAPECFTKKLILEEEFEPMVVWNLGSILLQLLLGTHKFPTLQSMQKFKGAAFSFEALGIKQTVSGKFTPQVKQALSYMLHFDPKKRTKLTQLFENRFLSEQVAKHYEQHRAHVPVSKIAFGKSSVRQSQLTSKSQHELAEVQRTLEDRQNHDKQTLQASRASGVLDEEQFRVEIEKITNSAVVPNFQVHGKGQPESIDQLMKCTDQEIRKALQLYKSYFDQSQLLMLSLEVIEKLQFVSLSSLQSNQLKLLIKYAITFVSLINLNSLAEGFNLNRNILDLDGNIYTAFQSSAEYLALQKIVNFKRSERSQALEQLKQQISSTKSKPLLANNPSLSQFLAADYKRTSFSDIKTSYRFIVKQAYDTVAEQYNELKKTEMATRLAQTAMHVTYCLTIDKLYIKEHITDNFKFYFEWLKQPASNYVPLSSFKNYLLSAEKEVLIEHSRFVLKKYYNI